MNKKLLSVAVAAAIAAPTAVLADAILYGKAHVSLDYFDLRVNDTGFKGWTMSKGKKGRGNTRASRIGVRGSEEIAGGLKGIYQVELGIPLANENDYHISDGDRDDPFGTGLGAGIRMRNSYVGLGGDFGTLLFGRHDTPYKLSTSRLEMFNDTMADNEGTVGFSDVRADNTVAFMSPNWSGFRFAVAAVPGAASTVDGTENDNSDGLAEGYSVAAVYGNGPWHFSAAYEVMGKELGNSNQLLVPAFTAAGGTNFLQVPGTADTTTAATVEDFKKLRVGLGMVDFHGFTLTGIYEDWKNGAFTQDVETDLWQVQTGYKFGNSKIKGMYGHSNLEYAPQNIDVKRKTWAVGLDHDFTTRTKVYALYTSVDVEETEENDWKGFSLGVMHDF